MRPRREPTPGEQRLAQIVAYVVVVGALSFFALFLVLALLRVWDALA